MDSLRYPSGPERCRRGGWREEGMQARERKTNKEKRRAAPAGDQMGGANNKVENKKV